REAAPERKRLEERLFHFERVFRGQRSHQLSAKVRIDVRGDEELRLTEAEAATRRRNLTTRRRKAGDLEVVRILRAACGSALQNDRDIGIERVGARAARRGWRSLFQLFDPTLQLLELGVLRERRVGRHGQ